MDRLQGMIAYYLLIIVLRALIQSLVVAAWLMMAALFHLKNVVIFSCTHKNGSSAVDCNMNELALV